MARISLYLDTRAESKSGLYRVKISVRNGSTAFFIPTEVRIAKENWADGKVKGVPNERMLNKALAMKLSTLRLKLVSVSLTENVRGMHARDLAALLDETAVTEKAKTASPLFLPFLEEYAAGKGKANTRNTYNSTAARLKLYTDTGKLTFTDITYKWLCGFDKWLSAEGCKTNTRASYMRCIRAVWNEGVKCDAVPADAYPFRKFSISTEDTVKRSLSAKELRLLRDCPKTEEQRYYTDFFFLSFYLAGINTADLVELPPSADGRIDYRRAKTGVPCRMSIPKEAAEIIERRRGKAKLVCYGEDFPERKTLIAKANAAFRSVKGKNEKPLFPELTTYWARHSWATIAADIDIPDAVIDAALGHRQQYRMTDVYIKRNEKKVDDAVRRVIHALDAE